MQFRPRARDPPVEHRDELVGPRQRERDVRDHGRHDREEEGVVHECGPCRPGDPRRRCEAHDDARHERGDHHRPEEGGLDLLASVELVPRKTRAAGGAPEPVEVGNSPAVEAAQVLDQSFAPGPGDSEHQRPEQGQTRDDVNVLDEAAMADTKGQRREVQDRPGDDQRQHHDRRAPMHQALDKVEAGQLCVRGHFDVRLRLRLRRDSGYDAHRR